jgi:hypothetical protein
MSASRVGLEHKDLTDAICEQEAIKDQTGQAISFSVDESKTKLKPAQLFAQVEALPEAMNDKIMIKERVTGSRLARQLTKSDI